MAHALPPSPNWNLRLCMACLVALLVRSRMGSVDHCIATFPNHASCIMDLFMWSAPCQLVQPLFSIFPPSHFISDVEEWETEELVTQESPRASANVSCHGRAECPKWTKDTWVS